jgi:hypothetical protein
MGSEESLPWPTLVEVPRAFLLLMQASANSSSRSWPPHPGAGSHPDPCRSHLGANCRLLRVAVLDLGQWHLSWRPAAAHLVKSTPPLTHTTHGKLYTWDPHTLSSGPARKEVHNGNTCILCQKFRFNRFPMREYRQPFPMLKHHQPVWDLKHTLSKSCVKFHRFGYCVWISPLGPCMAE